MALKELNEKLAVGDVVFIRIPLFFFRKVADDTGSWTNHVGIITGRKDGEWIVSESTFPLSKSTTLKRFIKRSEDGRAAISRLNMPIPADAHAKLQEAAHKRYWVLYDTGFNVKSRKQFCSRYVQEVVNEALGISLGDIETLEALLKRNPQADLKFWRMWYFGSIPWQRQTVTPASILSSPQLHSVFDGRVTM